MGLFINYAIDDFINNINNNINIIKDLNNRFNLDLKDNDNLEILDLSWKNLDIEKLDKMRIDNLKELNLSYNQISDIKVEHYYRQYCLHC